MLRNMGELMWGKMELGLKALAVILMIGQLPAAARAAPPLAVYGSLPGFERAAISNSGDHIALIGVVEGERRLIVLDRTQALVLVAPLGDVKVWDLSWAGDQYVLVETSNTTSLGIGFTADKAELTSTTVVPLATRKAWQIFAHNSMIMGGVRGFYGLNEKGGKWYGYFGGITLDTDGKVEPWLNSTNPVLYEVDLTNGRAVRIARRADSQKIDFNWLVGADGKVGVTLQYDSDSGKWTLFNADNHTIATGKNPLGGVDLISFGEKPDSVIYSEKDPATGSVRWLEVALGGGEAREVFPDEDIGEGFFDRRNRKFIGYKQQGDRPSSRHFRT
jgi:hypothetical protein